MTVTIDLDTHKSLIDRFLDALREDDNLIISMAARGATVTNTRRPNGQESTSDE